jgi:hypothetical protein
VSLVVAVLILVASLLEIITSNKSRKEQNDAELENNNNNNIEDTKEVKIGNGMKKKVVEVSKKKDKPKQNILMRILLCFSAINNGKKILNVDAVSEDSIKCVHGLRFFSIAWIIMVHTYLEVFSIGDNKNLRILTERTFMYQTIANATFSVDTFFFIR